jgi:hypothetical protein
MTAFLWHLTALFAVTASVLALGLPQPAVGDWQWWATRPVVLGLLALVTAVLVALFRPADRPRPARVGERPSSPSLRDTLAAVGMAVSVIGVLGLSMVGFGGALSGQTATFVVVPVTAASSLAGCGWLGAPRPQPPIGSARFGVATSAGVPRVRRTSSSKVVENTACG